MVYSQGFSTPSTLYHPDGLEGLIVDSFPHDAPTPNLKNGSGLVAQVWTITVGTAANSTTYTITFSRQGDFIGTVSFTSDADATATEARDGIIAKINGSGLIYGQAIATASGANVLVTSRTAGTANAFDIAVSGGGAGFAAAQTTAAANPAAIPFGRIVATGIGENALTAKIPAAATDRVRGVTVRTDAHESTLTGVDGYPPQQRLGVMNRGRIWLKPTTNWSPTDDVYYIHTGADAGKVRAGTAAGAAILPNCKFENSGTVGNLAIVLINL